MAANKSFRLGPVTLSGTYTTNIFNPHGTISGGVNSGTGIGLYAILRHIRITNRTGSPATARLYVGATGANAAGTDIVPVDVNVPANGSYDYYSPGLRLDVGDFLVGGASATAALTLTAEGEIGVA